MDVNKVSLGLCFCVSPFGKGGRGGICPGFFLFFTVFEELISQQGKSPLPPFFKGGRFFPFLFALSSRAVLST